MKILADTHILVWHLAGSPRLSPQARMLIESSENSIFYSAATPWEMLIKQSSHPGALPATATSLVEFCSRFDILPLPIESKHVMYLDQLNYHGAGSHRDPFDRIMLCQAAVEGMLFLTHDERLQGYGLENVLIV